MAVAFAAAAVFVAVGPAAAADAQAGGAVTTASAVPSAAPAPASILTRNYSLAALGYAGGLSLTGLSGQADLYFPVPVPGAVTALRLELPYSAASSDPARREFRVEVDGQPLATGVLPQQMASGTMIALPVPLTAVRDGFVHVRIVYGANQTQAGCSDDGAPGSYLTFAPEGGLVEELDPAKLDTVAAVAAAMPRANDLLLPQAPSTGQLAAAVLMMAMDPDARLAATAAPADASGDWRRAAIRFAPESAPALQAVREGGRPAIAVGGKDPVAAIRLLSGQWRALATAGHLGDVAEWAKGALPDRVSFAALGADTGLREVLRRATWNAALPAARLPAGTRLAGADVDVAVAADGEPSPPVVSVTLNGLLLGSAVARRDGPTRLRLDVPEGLQTLQNTLAVTVTRHVAGGACKLKPQAYPAQLLPSSAFRLAPAGPVRTFAGLAPLYRTGVTVVTGETGPAALTGIARVLAGLVGTETPLRLSEGASAPDKGAYVWVSDAPPPGSDPALRFDKGEVRLKTDRGTLLLGDGALRARTVVQLVRPGGRAVLWIRPGAQFGKGAPGAEPELPGQANVAVLNGGKPELAFSSDRASLFEISYPQRLTLLDRIIRYRLWLIAAGWLILSLGFVFLLRGILRARRGRG